jgi:hypothetical protein
MIRRVCEVDPLYCPICGRKTRIFSFIKRPKAIDRTIRHLKLTFEADRPPPLHNVQQELLMPAEEKNGSVSEGLLGCFLLVQGRSLT